MSSNDVIQITCITDLLQQVIPGTFQHLQTNKHRHQVFFFNPNYGKGRLDRPITGSRIVQADLVGPIEIPLI
jgi:hypothetical protein